MLKSETENGGEEEEKTPPMSPNLPDMNVLPLAPPVVPKTESPPPVPLHHADPISSLTRFHLLNAAYSRWPVASPSEADEYRVRWEGHASHIVQHIGKMEHDPASADVTVATKGFTMPAHRIVLAATSKFFNSVLQCVPPSQHPVIVVRGAEPLHLRCIITFCYTGSISVPAKDIQHIVKLADDLEIAGLKVSNLPGTSTSNNNNAILSSSEVFPTPLRPHLYCPSSPKKFTFSPISRVSPLSSALQARGEDFSRERSPHQDNQPRKRFRGDPLPLDRGGETLGSSPPSNSTTPPGSAPPLLPSTSFFGGEGNLSPPNSAPPQTFAHRPTPAYDHDSSTGVKSELSPLSLVSPLRLMEQVPHSSAPPSPLTKKESPSPCPSPSFMSIPNTPRCLALALKEPLTPSTPRTPTTPNSSDNSRVGNLNSSHSGCSTGSRVLLWRFLLDLLHNPRFSPIYIRWLDRPAGIFRIMESDMVAQLWGMARKNSNMNYEKMSRGMRTYYKRGILFHIDGTKLIYKFNTSDPEIQQRMRYYDLTQKSEGADVATEQQSSSNQAMSPTLTAFPNVPAFPNLPVAVTSSSGPTAGSTSIESLYSPFLRDVPQLPAGFLYDPYLNFLRASQRELY